MSLTRAQVIECVRGLEIFIPRSCPDLKQTLRDWNNHDATLRAEVERLQAAIEQYKQASETRQTAGSYVRGRED